MNSRFSSNNFNIKTLFQFSDIDKNVQLHLKNVYGMLAIGLLSAFVGAYSFMVSYYIQGLFHGLHLITSLATLIPLFYIHFTEHKRETLVKRSLAYMIFTTLTGLNVAPLLRYISFVDPSIIPTALFGTAMIFASFTLASLLTRKRYYLYLAGALMSACSLLSIMAFANIFVRSDAVNSVSLYLGLGVFCAFVIFDTQMMVEKRRLGDTDFIAHSLELFIDFVQIFIRIASILVKNKERRRRDRDD